MNIDVEHLSNLLSQSRPIVIPKKTIIQTSDWHSNIVYMKTGYVKRYNILNDGRTNIQSIYGPGHIFPLSLIFKSIFSIELYDGPEIFFYETIVESIMYITSLEILLKALESDQSLYKDLLFVTSQRLTSNIQRLENSALHNSCKQLGHQLLFLARHFGQPTDCGIVIQVPLTQALLAEIICHTRETISMAMAKLSEQGLAEFNKYTLIPSLQRLEDWVYN